MLFTQHTKYTMMTKVQELISRAISGVRQDVDRALRAYNNAVESQMRQLIKREIELSEEKMRQQLLDIAKDMVYQISEVGSEIDDKNNNNRQLSSECLGKDIEIRTNKGTAIVCNVVAYGITEGNMLGTDGNVIKNIMTYIIDGRGQKFIFSEEEKIESVLIISREEEL